MAAGDYNQGAWFGKGATPRSFPSLGCVIPTRVKLAEDEVVVYPSSDGEPMAENTLQFEWITMLKGNLDAICPDFVAGDLLWYPIKGQPKTRVAPDVMVALGRPKGHRSSYLQWEEDGVAPQVVFEVLSPGNTVAEMMRKNGFYQHFGVEEFYLVDPQELSLAIYRRQNGFLELEPEPYRYRSHNLGIRFELTQDGLEVLGPDHIRFRSFAEFIAEVESAKAEASSEKARADALEKELSALRAKLGEG